MEEEEFGRCTEKLLSMLGSFKRIIDSPGDIRQSDLDGIKDSIEYIHSSVNSI